MRGCPGTTPLLGALALAAAAAASSAPTPDAPRVGPSSPDTGAELRPLSPAALGVLASELFGGDSEHAAALPWDGAAALWRPDSPSDKRGPRRRDPPAWHSDPDGASLLSPEDLWAVVRSAVSVHHLGQYPEPIFGRDIDVVRAVRNTSTPAAAGRRTGDKQPQPQPQQQPEDGKRAAGPKQARRSAGGEGAGGPAEPPSWTVETRHGHADTDTLQSDALRQGHSVVVHNLEQRWPAVNAVCGKVGAAVGCPCEASAWLTPPDAAARPPHADLREVFVLQLQGRKTWRLWNADGPAPLPRVSSAPGAAAAADEAARSANLSHARTVDLAPGDVLFLPRGTVRYADTKRHDQPSLHVTLGLDCAGAKMVWEEVLHHALSVFAGQTPEVETGRPQAYDPPSGDDGDLEPGAGEVASWKVAWRAVMHLMVRAASEHDSRLRRTVPGLAGTARDWDRLHARLTEMLSALRSAPADVSADDVAETPVDSRLIAWVVAGVQAHDSSGKVVGVTSGSASVQRLLESLRSYLGDLVAELWTAPPGAGGVAAVMEEAAAQRRKVPGAANAFRALWEKFVDSIDAQAAFRRMAALRQQHFDKQASKAEMMLRMHGERRGAI